MSYFSRFIAIIVSMSMIFSNMTLVASADTRENIIEVNVNDISDTYTIDNSNDTYRIYGNGNEVKNKKIEIKGGNPTIYLNNINLSEDNFLGINKKSPIDIIDRSNATIILENQNILVGDDGQSGVVSEKDREGHPAIWVEDGSSLTIKGKGTLKAFAGNNVNFVGDPTGEKGIGIGKGSGRINIESGIVISNRIEVVEGEDGLTIGSGKTCPVLMVETPVTPASTDNGIFKFGPYGTDDVSLSENGVALKSGTFTVYGSPISDNNISVENGAVLNIGENSKKATLTMNSGKTITNNGTLNIGGTSELILKDGKSQAIGNDSKTNGNLAGLIRVPISDATMTINDDNNIYNGKEQIPAISNVKTSVWGKEQSYGTKDYSITSKNIDATEGKADAKATVSATAGGKFLAGSTREVDFVIKKASPSGADRNNWRIWKDDDSPVLPVPTFTGVDGNKLSGTVKWYFSENDTVIVEGKGGNLADKVKENSGSIDESNPSFNVYYEFIPSDNENYNTRTNKNSPMGIIITEKQPVTVVIKEDGKEIEGSKITNVYTKTPKELAVELKDKDGGAISTAGLNLTYTWEVSDPQIASVENDTVDPSKATLKIKDVGTVTIKVRVESDNHAKSTGVFDLEVTPKELTVNDSTLNFGLKEYDGTNIIPKTNIPKIDISDQIEKDDVVSLGISAVISGNDFSVGKKDVDVVYSLEGTDASKYTIKDTEKTIKDAIEITKIDDNTPGKPAGKTANLTIKNKQESEYKFDLSKLVPDKVGNIEIGTCTFTASADSDASNYIDSTKGLTISGNTLIVPVKYVNSTKTGEVGTITVTINGTNFNTKGTIKLIAENTTSSGGGGGTITPPKDPSKPDDEIIGDDRYDTAGKIADSIGDYDSAILVNATKTLSDGLSAASISGKEKAPILLTKKDSIPEATMKRLAKAKTVYIIGGEEAISKKVESQLKGKKIIRLGGDTRFETSLEIEEYIGDYDKAFIVNGYTGEADAMSASAAAAKYNAPIILTNGKSSEYKKESGVSYYAIGGKTVLSDNIVKTYSAKRIGGSDRYKTNRMFIEEFYPYSATYYFTKGEPLVDALTASYIARNSGVVLVSKNSDNSILKGKELIQIGGMPFSILPLK